MVLAVRNPHTSPERFRDLMDAIRRGELNRNVFLPWEMRVILDLVTHDLSGDSGRRLLSAYQRAVLQALARKGGEPMTLSQFIRKRTRQAS